MTLRIRLLVGAVVVALVVVGGSWTVSVQHRSFVLDETDARLERLIPVARAAVRKIDNSSKTPQALVNAVSDAWIGRLSPDGTITTVIAPADDPTLLPVVSADSLGQGPSTHGTSSGMATHVRLLSQSQGNGQRIIVAIPMEKGMELLAAINRISVALAAAVITLLMLMVWWVNRLGIAPLEKMTDAARRIAAGHTDVRVPTSPGNAEAAVLADALNSMVDELKRSDERIKQFLADASHELRTPLTTVRGYADLYETGALTTERDFSDAMRRIHSEADRMNRIVADLLELRSVEDTVLTLVPHRIDEILIQCADDLRVAYPERIITTDTVEVAAPVDAARITQVVMALGTNAAEHTPDYATITLSTRQVPGSVRIEVVDTGPGIDNEHVSQLFERMYRVDKVRTSGRHSGIGLSIVAAIVTAHGGRYGVDTDLGEGSRFWVELPSAE